MGRRRSIALMLAGCVILAGTAVPAAAADPWTGKSRQELETLLGEPTKEKKKSDGSALLVYKLVRLEEGAIPPPEMTVLNVPGVGVVAQMQRPGAMDGDEVSIRPTEMDAAGRGTGGGIESEETHSISWDTDGKKIERSWEGSERPAIRGKVTLKFQLTAGGTIDSWSVSPKKARQDG